MGSFSLAVLFIVTVHSSSCTRVQGQSVLQRTLISVFVDTKNSNLTCLLPTVAQQMLCLEEPGLQSVFDIAKQLALKTCRTSFQFEPWQCTPPSKQSFEIASRETAFLFALYSGTLVYVVARACSRGLLVSCNCGLGGSPSDTARVLAAGLCPDNVSFGVKFSQSLLHIGKKDPYQFAIQKHNAVIGIKVVKASLEEKCSCFGMLASCHVKLCYKMLKPFSVIVKALKAYYHSAVVWHPPNTFRSRLKRKFARHLLYTVPTGARCHTAGRACLHRTHCAALCCGRGFHTHTQLRYWYCQCYWVHSLSLQCNVCQTQRFTYSCR